jgi:hypothetical protein
LATATRQRSSEHTEPIETSAAVPLGVPDQLLAAGLLAVAAIGVAWVETRLDDQGRLTLVALWSAAVFAASAIGYVLRRIEMPRFLASLVLLVAAGWPLMTAAVMSTSWPPLELLLLRVMRNAALAALLLPARRSRHRLAIVISLFLSLVSSALTPGLAASTWVAAPVLLGILWLWQDRGTQAAARISAEVAPRRRSRLPVAPGVSVAACVAIVAACVFSTSGRTAQGSRGWFASSGGTLAGSELAGGGIGDGPDEAPADKNPRAAGFDASNVFVESDQASLYDALLENYGQPSRVTKTPRMQMLRRSEINVGSGAVMEDLRLGKKFDLVRTPPSSAAGDRPKPNTPPALAYVRGSAAPYLRLATYSEFDGSAWHGGAAELPAGSIGKPSADRWFTAPPRGGGAALASEQQIEVRVGGAGLPVLPLPNNATRFRMGQFVRPDLFTERTDGIVRLTAREVPAGAVVEVAYRPTAADLIANVQAAAAPRRSAESAAATCSPVHADVRRLAAEWTTGVATPWQKVQGIVAGLHRHAVLDPAAVAAADSADPVGDFLLHRRRGPAYLFASSAAVLLREAGIDARLASGLRVNRDRYNSELDQTPVLGEDLHVWAEIRLADDTWVEVEATPGLSAPYSHPPLHRRLTAVAHAARQWLVHHALPVGTGNLAVALAAVFRRRLMERIATVGVLASSTFRDDRSLVMATVRLLELRAECRGRPRPRGTPPSQWLRSQANPSSDDAAKLAKLFAWAAYAPAESPPPVRDARRVCFLAIIRHSVGRESPTPATNEVKL